MSNSEGGQELSTSAPRVLFGILTGYAGYMAYLCLVPPTPPAGIPGSFEAKPDASVQDSITFIHAGRMLSILRTLPLAIAVYQALHIAFSPSMQPGAPQRGSAINYPLNKTLLTFNFISVPVLLSIIAATYIRFAAFAELGRNFTFDLQVPNQLTTSGVYAYAQHPSYTSGWIALVANAIWFSRLDGSLALVVPEWIRRYERGVHLFLGVGIPLFFTAAIGVRVMDEERMLRAQFGEEWQEWAGRTARFIPGLI